LGIDPFLLLFKAVNGGDDLFPIESYGHRVNDHFTMRLNDWCPESEVSQKSPIFAGSKLGPRLEASLTVKLVGEIDIRPAVQQTAQIHSCPFQVDRVDLEVTPVERAVRIVMMDFAVPAGSRRVGSQWLLQPPGSPSNEPGLPPGRCRSWQSVVVFGRRPAVLLHHDGNAWPYALADHIPSKSSCGT
jgi:hypothetical protein